MPERQIVIYFTNGRMVRIPESQVRFAHMGQPTDEEYKPAIEGNVAVVNWDNVAYVRYWQEPEEDL